MPVEVGTDSYISQAEADAYAATRPALAAWAGLTPEVKEAHLRDAAIYLDTSYVWKGTIADVAQLLAWPRLDVTDKEGREVSGVPQAVKNAQAELAVRAITGDLVTERTTGNVESIKAGEVSIKFVKGQNASEGERFAGVNRVLSGLYLYAPGVGSANVKFVRA